MGAERVNKVLAHYESRSEEDAFAEDEAAFETIGQTIMEVPTEIVPAVRDLIARHKAAWQRFATNAPLHPREVLWDELEEIGLTQSALAKPIGVLPKTINEICRKKRRISADMAMKLAKALGGSPRFWLLHQNEM